MPIFEFKGTTTHTYLFCELACKGPEGELGDECALCGEEIQECKRTETHSFLEYILKGDWVIYMQSVIRERFFGLGSSENPLWISPFQPGMVVATVAFTVLMLLLAIASEGTPTSQELINFVIVIYILAQLVVRWLLSESGSIFLSLLAMFAQPILLLWLTYKVASVFF